MSRAVQVFPWVLVVALSVGLGGVWFKLNDQLKQKDAELSALSQKLDQVRSDAFRIITEADQKHKALATEANQRLAEANGKFQELAAAANEQIELANLPEAQVSVAFRKALLSSGNVVKIINTSTTSIAITAEIERTSTGRKRAYDLTLDANHAKEIGEFEGWAFVSGDVITIRQAGHKVLTFTAS